MSRGGKRPGAGRPKGAVTRRSREVADKAAAVGETPLEYMLQVMRNSGASDARRDEMAKAAAPYVHPKLASMQHSGPNGGPIEIDLTGLSDEQLAALEPVLAILAALTGGSGGVARAGAGGKGEASD